MLRPPDLIRAVLLCCFILPACSPLSGSSLQPLVTPGTSCPATERGARLSCTGGDGVASCPYQVCDPQTLVASFCTAAPCSDPPLPPPGPPVGGGVCEPGQRRDCTTTDGSLLAGLQICDVSGNWMMCIPRGPLFSFDGGTSDGGMSTACDLDPQVLAHTACTVGVGACANTGTFMCVSGVKTCSAMAGMPSSEGVVPDHIDQDCDGTADNITAGCYSGPAGTSGIGICHPGTHTFTGFDGSGNPTWSPCSGEVVPSAEIADNAIDEDCNGALLLSAPCGHDPRVGMACSAGIGSCTNTGTYSCVGSSLVCSAVPFAAAPEVCDNLDNDCDGLIDGNTRSCYSGAPGTAGVGLCRAGTQTCTAGAFGVCTGEVDPAAEICDNASDEDCNGINDACVVCGHDSRVFPTPQICTAGIGACQRSGHYQCSAGVVSCDAVIGAATDEICNAIDDDCDGSIDEMVTRSCSTFASALGGIGICRLGTQACLGVDAALNPVYTACMGEVGPAAETCGDSIDQDCNGGDLACSACGGDPRIGNACNVGVGRCLTAGTYQCMTGSDFRCVPSTAPLSPVPETCNGVDDNCNGSIDENAAGSGSLTTSCYPFVTGLPGVGICASGVSTCAFGSFGSCVGAVGPATEVCNGLDDDCDGGIDDGVCMSMVDAGHDAGSDAGVDAFVPGSDAGPPPVGSAAAERTACRDLRAAQPFTGNVSLGLDLACVNASFGLCPSGWQAGIYDQNGCFVPSDPGVLSVAVDLAQTGGGTYRTGLRCGSVFHAWPGPQNTAPVCATSYVVDTVSKLAGGRVCPGAGGLLPTFPASAAGAAVSCP